MLGVRALEATCRSRTCESNDWTAPEQCRIGQCRDDTVQCPRIEVEDVTVTFLNENIYRQFNSISQNRGFLFARGGFRLVGAGGGCMGRGEGEGDSWGRGLGSLGILILLILMIVSCWVLEP